MFGEDSAPISPQVSILVVSYNTREMTLACLRSVVAETQATYELIVIDNASSDGSAAAIAAEFPDIKLLAETENHGFAKANNIAAKSATGTHILLLNPDTVVLDGAIDKLLAFAEETPEAKIWGGRTLFGDKTLNPTNCYQRMTLWNVFCRATGIGPLFGNHRFVSEAYGSFGRDQVMAVDIVTGCYLLIPRTLWETLGGFNLTYFMYGEEADLCLRATRDHGAAPMVTPGSEIIHYGGASEPVRSDKMVRLFRAKLTLVRHHFQGWQRPIGRALFRAIPFSRSLALQLIAAVTRKESHKTSARVWSEIWARRNEWQDGFPDVADPSERVV